MVSTRRRPTLRSRWLGREFRKLREPTGRKIGQVAEHLGRDPSGVSRFEGGAYALPHSEVVAMLDLYELPEGPHRALLVELAEEEWRTDWWDAYADDVDGSLLDAIWLESKALEVQGFDLTFVNGLLQTPDYTRALATAVRPHGDERAVDRLVQMRLARQTVLERTTPPGLSLVVDEAALRRAVGGAPVLADQVRALAAAAARPHVEIRVLPFSVGAHAGADCGFRLLKLAEPFVEVVLLDRPSGIVVVEAPDSARFGSVYAELKASALDPAESVEMLNVVAAQLERS